MLRSVRNALLAGRARVQTLRGRELDRSQLEVARVRDRRRLLHRDGARTAADVVELRIRELATLLAWRRRNCEVHGVVGVLDDLHVEAVGKVDAELLEDLLRLSDEPLLEVRVEPALGNDFAEPVLIRHERLLSNASFGVFGDVGGIWFVSVWQDGVTADHRWFIDK